MAKIWFFSYGCKTGFGHGVRSQDGEVFNLAAAEESVGRGTLALHTFFEISPEQSCALFPPKDDVPNAHAPSKGDEK